MERRDALKYTMFLVGAGLSASSVSAILAGCKVDTSDQWKPVFFTEDEVKFIEELADTMLPKTNTPGAKDAMVVRFMDTVRPLRYTAEENQKFKENLTAFISTSRTELGNDRSSQEKRLEWLKALDQKSYEAIKANPEMPDDQKPFYLELKGNILGAYFSSEIVAKEYFAFDPIPGRYDPCIPYEQVGKAWALD